MMQRSRLLLLITTIIFVAGGNYSDIFRLIQDASANDTPDEIEANITHFLKKKQENDFPIPVKYTEEGFINIIDWKDNFPIFRVHLLADHNEVLEFKRTLNRIYKTTNNYQKKICYSLLSDVERVTDEIILYYRSILEKIFIIPSSIDKLGEIWPSAQISLAEFIDNMHLLKLINTNVSDSKIPIKSTKEQFKELEKYYRKLQECYNNKCLKTLIKAHSAKPSNEGINKQPHNLEMFNVTEMAEFEQCLVENAEKIKAEINHIPQAILFSAITAHLHNELLQLQRKIRQIRKIGDYQQGCHLLLADIDEMVAVLIDHYRNILNVLFEVSAASGLYEIWSQNRSSLLDFAISIPLRGNAIFEIKPVKEQMNALNEFIKKLDECNTYTYHMCYTRKFRSYLDEKKYGLVMLNIAEIIELEACLVMYSEQIKTLNDGFNRNKSVLLFRGILARMYDDVVQIRQNFILLNSSECQIMCALELNDVGTAVDKLFKNYWSIVEAAFFIPTLHKGKLLLESRQEWLPFYTLGMYMTGRPNFDVTPNTDFIHTVKWAYAKLNTCTYLFSNDTFECKSILLPPVA